MRSQGRLVCAIGLLCAGWLPLRSEPATCSFAVSPSQTVFSRNPADLYELRIFEGLVFFGYCDGGCSITNVLVNGGTLDSYTVIPPVLPPNGGLALIVCVVRQSPLETNGEIVVEVPCINATITNSFIYPEMPLPTIVTEPADSEVMTGTEALFSVEASFAVNYHWQRNGVDLIEMGHIRGVTNSTLVISHASVADTGYYSVIVGNPSGNVMSTPALLTVHRGRRLR